MGFQEIDEVYSCLFSLEQMSSKAPLAETERKEIEKIKAFFSSKQLSDLTNESSTSLEYLINASRHLDPALYQTVIEAVNRVFCPSAESHQGSKTDSLEGVAQFINQKKVSLQDLQFSQKELLQLAPHLTYINISAAIQAKREEVFTKEFLFQFFSAAKNVESLDASDLESLTDELLWALPCPEKIKTLYVSDCPNITKLPDLPGCKVLHCYSCANLESLGNLSVCEELLCPGTNIFTIGDLEQCSKMDCSECESLVSIGNLLRCRELNVSGCVSLEEVGVLSDEVEITHDGCPFYELTKPTLHVDIDVLKQTPKESLLELFAVYTHVEFFPYIHYEQNGKELPSIDAGGVTRDFITKLFTYLLDESHPNKLEFKTNEEGRKILSQSHLVEDEVPIRALARMLAFCWEEEATLGPVFPSYLFSCLQTKDVLSFYLLHQGITPLVARLALAEPSDPLLFDQTLCDFAGFLLDPVNGVDKEFFLQEENREQLKEFIEEEAENDPFCRAFMTLAEELEAFLGEEAWVVFCAEDPKRLEASIQGELSKAVFAKALRWGRENPHVSEQQILQSKKYFAHWIHKASTKELEAFTYMATGSASIGPSQRLRIDLKNIDTVLFHTCSCSCDFPLVDNLETFTQVMEAAVGGVDRDAQFSSA